MLDLDASRPPVVPRPAATIVLLREVAGSLEVFCVERSGKSSFLAGALVFPGGAVDPADRAWADEGSFALDARASELAEGDVRAEAFALAALRETLEEAGILLATGAAEALSTAAIATLRNRLLGGTSLRQLLGEAGLAPAVERLVPFSRWVTPVAEKKRFDTAFFVAEAPHGQLGTHDDAETVSSQWATPAHFLARWEQGEVAIVPPTHATLEWLATCPTVAHALEAARSLSLAPICPELGSHEGSVALLLPGDPEHSDPVLRHGFAPRYVLAGDRFYPKR